MWFRRITLVAAWGRISKEQGDLIRIYDRNSGRGDGDLAWRKTVAIGLEI